MHSSKIIQSISNESKSATGNHAICYDHPESKDKILLATKCPVRVHLTSKGAFKSKHFPKIKRIGAMADNTPVYEMPKYYDLRLKENHNKLSARDKRIFWELQHRAYNLPSIKRSKIIPKSMKVGIIRAYRDMEAKGLNVCFDICDHNIMMTKDGQLIFTDLFWIHKRDYIEDAA